MMKRLAFLLTVIPLLMVPVGRLAEARCAGLQGSALEQCLKGDRQDQGARQVTFFSEDGKHYDLEAAAVTKSIETVCHAGKQDGVYTAYRTVKGRTEKWKELTCRRGKLEGLWKEFFNDEEITTVLSYDASGTALMQAVYMNGQLLKEQPLGQQRR